MAYRSLGIVGVLYRVIDEPFVEQEFRDFLTCGLLSHGFARLRCTDCAFERLVPFSCKGRCFCPSCGGRRMTDCAARMVDEVLPRVPVRRWREWRARFPALAASDGLGGRRRAGADRRASAASTQAARA